MTIRMTGLSSNMDTESMITALTSTYQTKVDDLKGEQKKLSWTQDTWKTLNTQINSFYNGSLSSMRFSTAYAKKSTTASNTTAVTVVTGDSAMNASQKLNITSLATSAYLTGSKLSSKSSITSSSTMSDIGLESDGKLKFKIGKDNTDGTNTDTIEIDVATTDTIASVISKINNAKSADTSTSISANFDATNGRIYLGSKASGEAAGFDFSSDTDSGVLKALGLDTTNGAQFIAGEDATISLNGVDYTSSSNTFEINGLTLTVNEKANDITLNTKSDTSTVYDTIKNFITEYNTIVNKMSTLYNADSIAKYDMLTDDAKEDMSEDDIKAWEDKIKSGLLRRDTTLGTAKDSLAEIMQESVEYTDASGNKSTLYLSDFGIGTLGYFKSTKNERDALHIDGNKDDTNTSGKTDLLSQAIAADPDKVSAFFTKLSNNLYTKLTDLMKHTDYSSAYTIYEDKLMASQYSAYTDDIEDAEDKLTAKQDYYYNKFSSMESSLSSLNSTTSSLSSLFGSSS